MSTLLPTPAIIGISAVRSWPPPTPPTAPAIVLPSVPKLMSLDAAGKTLLLKLREAHGPPVQNRSALWPSLGGYSGSSGRVQEAIRQEHTRPSRVTDARRHRSRGPLSVLNPGPERLHRADERTSRATEGTRRWIERVIASIVWERQHLGKKRGVLL